MCDACFVHWILFKILWEDFYGEQLAGDFRSERFWELAKKESIPKHRFERIMQEESKVHLARFRPVPDPRKHTISQVPCLFSFVDVHSSKGLNEDTVHLTKITIMGD